MNTRERFVFPSKLRAFGADRHGESSDPILRSGGEWRQQWQELLKRLYASGHYSSDPNITYDSLEEDRGAVKRAVLSFARQRAEILSALNPRYIKALVAAGVPADQADRKAKNAYRRLEASFIQGIDLPPGDGGPADFQDVLRLILALAHTNEPAGNGNVTSRLASAASMMLPEVIAAMDASDGSQGEMSAKAKNIARMQKGGGAAPPKLP